MLKPYFKVCVVRTKSGAAKVRNGAAGGDVFFYLDLLLLKMISPHTPTTIESSSVVAAAGWDVWRTVLYVALSVPSLPQP